MYIMSRVTDFTAAKATKNFIETANNRIQELEEALYQILDLKTLSDAKEVASEVLGEDLDIYLEEDLEVEELDFSGDKWNNVKDEDTYA